MRLLIVPILNIFFQIIPPFFSGQVLFLTRIVSSWLPHLPNSNPWIRLFFVIIPLQILYLPSPSGELDSASTLASLGVLVLSNAVGPAKVRISNRFFFLKKIFNYGNLWHEYLLSFRARTTAPRRLRAPAWRRAGALAKVRDATVSKIVRTGIRVYLNKDMGNKKWKFNCLFADTTRAAAATRWSGSGTCTSGTSCQGTSFPTK